MLKAQSIDIAALRKLEFARLEATGSTYLDYTGAALYPASLVCRDANRLTTQVLGNPHSESRPSAMSTEAMEEARLLTLRFLNADPAEYEVVFTANATGAMRILADSFPFRAGSRLVMTADNHNSVNGLAVPAKQRRAAVEYVPLSADLSSLDPGPWLPASQGAPSLFAFPAQSNFSGVQHPLSWVSRAQGLGYRVLLDAAGFAPSNPLSLQAVPADFVAISFYKLFGYPTGVGALVAKREALAELEPGYYSGGTVQFVSIQNRLVRLKEGAERFEQGTANFLAMPAVCDGLNWLTGIGVKNIQNHVAAASADLLHRLACLEDRVRIYGPRTNSGRGGTFTLNFYRDGQLLPFEEVEASARDRGIAIRGGCFCNPGAAEQAFEIPAGLAQNCLQAEFTIPRFRACLGNRPVGAIRISTGIATNTADLDSLSAFAAAVTT